MAGIRAAAAIFMLIFGQIYFRENKRKSRRPLIFKALATFMACLLSICYAVRTGSLQGWWTAAGIVCYMAADVLLEIRLVAGAACFGLGHICLLAGIFQKYSWTWHWGICFLLLYGGMFFIIRPYLKYLKELLIPAILYAFLLCFMASSAIMSGFQSGGAGGAAAVLGGICFVISDTILGWGYLSGKSKRIYSAVLLILYYAAVYFFAVGLH